MFPFFGCEPLKLSHLARWTLNYTCKFGSVKRAKVLGRIHMNQPPFEWTADFGLVAGGSVHKGHIGIPFRQIAVLVGGFLKSNEATGP